MQKKLLAVPFIVMLVLVLVFVSTQIPMTKMAPKDIAIGFVVADDGQLAMLIQENVQKAMASNDALDIQLFDSQQDMEQALQNRELYGGIVIPENFSAAVQSLATPTPMRLDIQYYINEGQNANVSTMLQTMFTQLNSTINDMMRAQLLQQMEASGVAVPAAQVEGLIAPVKADVQVVNATGDLATAPTVFFQPLWFASILGAVLFVMAGKKSVFSSRKEQLTFNILQSVVAIVYSFIAGYFVTWCTRWILGFEFESFHTVALFVSMACIAFLFLIKAALVWIGLPVIAVFVLLMFYGLPLIQLAPEMLPAFYQDFIVSWIPFKFLIEGLKDILFFGSGLINDNTTILMWIFVVSFIAVWVKNSITKVEQ